MTRLQVEVSAPANIALIKYMGKAQASNNLPTNSSLSYTLENLRSFVRISKMDDIGQDEWAPLEGDGFMQLNLNEKSKQRFLNHFQNLKAHFQIQGSFLIESANNFPSDCGLASSASSFAALTMAATEIFEKIDSRTASVSWAERAELSRLGSGSSCRSFFGPWTMWFREGVRPVEFPIPRLSHQVLVVEQEKKSVSSSEAHQRVLSSLLFVGRPERAERRLAELMAAFGVGDWKLAQQISWAEFWDMHSLFETSDPHFGYMLPASLKVLRFFEELWVAEDDGPLVTMDAGANVHALYRPDQESLMIRVRDEFKKEMSIFQNLEPKA